MDASIIIIHYHTPQLLANLLDSFFDTTSLVSYNIEIIIVNNGGEIPSEIFRHHPIKSLVLSPNENKGYAGGINMGVSHSNGSKLIFMNADLILHQGSIIKLFDILDNYDIAGPRFYWDIKKTILLPPIENTGTLYEINKTLSGSFSLFRDWFYKSWNDTTYSHIFTNVPKDSYLLSGAMIAFTKTAWNKVGEMDEGFQLYFEETDWLIRAKKKKLRSVYHNGSEVTHIYNQSAKLERTTQTRFIESAKRFSQKHDHFLKRALIKLLKKFTYTSAPLKQSNVLSRTKVRDNNFFQPFYIPQSLSTIKHSLYLEISPFWSFVPSAVAKIEYEMIGQNWTIPSDVWEYAQPGQYHFRIVDSQRKEYALHEIRDKNQ